MRRLLAALAAVTVLTPSVLAGPVLAAERCAAPAEQSMFELAALKSELLVLAISCKRNDAYNAFVQKYRTQLLDLDKNLNAHFKRVYGARWQKMADDFTTDMANLRATSASRMGGDHCPRNGMIFNEVMSLPTAADLPAYAAGKDLMPANVVACSSAPTVTHASATTRAHPAPRHTAPARR